MRIAVVGTGISGLAAAWLLAPRHEVWVFEREGRAGGHSHTVTLRRDGRDVPLDTGFMVFNHATYPNLTRLLAALSVPTRPSDMSFSASCRCCDLEYSGSGLAGLFAQPSNLLRPSFLGLLRDVVRFNRAGRAALAAGLDDGVTVADFLAAAGLSDDLARHYLLPMTGAIWSTGSLAAARFPARALLRFFANHGLLGLTTHHQWHTVVGGSRVYVEAMTAAFRDRLRLACPVAGVAREARGVTVRLADGGSERFDRVVIATHADEALALLDDPGPEERELLGAWRYSHNLCVLHSDPAFLPRRRAARASWNALVDDCRAGGERAQLTYDLGRLQGHGDDPPFLLTLNPGRDPAPGLEHRRLRYTHPLLDAASLSTQADLPRLNGPRHTFFCGAYFGWGFHEDGLEAGIRVAEALGASFP